MLRVPALRAPVAAELGVGLHAAHRVRARGRRHHLPRHHVAAGPFCGPRQRGLEHRDLGARAQAAQVSPAEQQSPRACMHEHLARDLHAHQRLCRKRQARGRRTVAAARRQLDVHAHGAARQHDLQLSSSYCAGGLGARAAVVRGLARRRSGGRRSVRSLLPPEAQLVRDVPARALDDVQPRRVQAWPLRLLRHMHALRSLLPAQS